MNAPFAMKPIASPPWPAIPFAASLAGIGGALLIELASIPVAPGQWQLFGVRLLQLALFVVLIRRYRLFAPLGLGWPDRAGLRVFGFVAMAALLVGGGAVALLPEVRPLLGLPPFAHGLPGLLLMLLIGPLVEEFLFRGWLHALLRQSFGFIPSLIASSLAFSLAHGYFALPQLIGGLLFGFVYEKSRNLWLAVALHVGANAAVWLLG